MSNVYGFEIGTKTADVSKVYGFEVGLIKAASMVYGFEVGLNFDLTVNVVDDESNPLPNQTIQIYDTDDNLLDSVFTASGSWYFSLFEPGTYKISTSSSDRIQQIVFDGETALEAEFIVIGKTYTYRIRSTEDQEYTNEVTVKI